MKLNKALVATLCAASLMGVSASTQADLFKFQPCGNATCTVNGAATIDEAPGNDLGIGGVVGGGGPLPVGTVIHDLYQANLTAVLGTASNILFANGAGGAFFTFVAGFSETVVASSAVGPTVTNSFGIDPGGFFKICAQGALGSDLNGTGFSCGTGATILSGHVVSGNATQTGFLTSLAPLDQSPDGNNYPGITTVTSSGAANLTLQVDSVNTGYFPDLLQGGFITTSLTNTSNITPFGQVNPSSQFSIDGVANGGTPNNIGTINGITGPNFQFQADANSSFQRTVPEPGTLALLGIAIAGMGGIARRRSKVR
jgi:PEP-CTERM motif